MELKNLQIKLRDGIEKHKFPLIVLAIGMEDCCMALPGQHAGYLLLTVAGDGNGHHPAVPVDRHCVDAAATLSKPYRRGTARAASYNGGELCRGKTGKDPEKDQRSRGGVCDVDGGVRRRDHLSDGYLPGK